MRFIFIEKSLDYNEYLNSNQKTKIKLMFDFILECIKSVSKKGKINYLDFKLDAEDFYKNYHIRESMD